MFPPAFPNPHRIEAGAVYSNSNELIVAGRVAHSAVSVRRLRVQACNEVWIAGYDPLQTIRSG